MSRAKRRAPLSQAARGILRRLAAAGGRVAVAADLVRSQGDWSVLATLHGRMLVRWDEGGRNVRLTAYGRQYLASI